MAWNPSPEVAVARDAAVQIEKINKTPTALCVVFHLSERGIGYASYGANKALCGKARELADHLMKAAETWGEEDQ